MRASLILGTLVLLVISSAIGAPFISRHRDRELKDRFQASCNVQPQWFRQRLDHYNFQDGRTWNQRYFINDTFYNPKQGGPIFMELGGEGAISSGYVCSFMMNEYASKHGALVVALEHRFYGASQPFADLATENLAYLNSQQALADAANFVLDLRKRYPASTAVFTFGGSYPGSLAAWFRLKYPTLTVGSIASSAPVEAMLDMYTYMEVVQQAIIATSGQSCINSIKEATTELEKLLSTPQGALQVRDTFNLCQTPVAPHDIQNLASELAGNFQGAVQYNSPGGSGSIQAVCQTMTDASLGTPLERYARVNSDLNPSTGCLDISYKSMIYQYKNTSYSGQNGVGIRQWIYQTCAEFGYFQTTTSKNQPFGNLIPLSFYTAQDICRDVYGLTSPPLIDAVNAYYGSKTPVGSNVCFVNGSVDPWHSLSVLKSLDSRLPAVFIEGTSHCADMRPARPIDPPGLAKAQARIGQIIADWLPQ